MKFYKILLVALVGLLMINSCKKDEESAADLLTGGTWQLTESRSDTDGDGTIESDLEACSADDTIDFATDGTYRTDEGATKCDPGDDQSTSGTWALSSEDKVLTISEGGISIAAEIINLTSSRMELKVTLFGVQEVVYTR